MTTFRNKATVHKIGQRHSIDDTEIDNGTLLNVIQFKVQVSFRSIYFKLP